MVIPFAFVTSPIRKKVWKKSFMNWFLFLWSTRISSPSCYRKGCRMMVSWMGVVSHHRSLQTFYQALLLAFTFNTPLAVGFALSEPNKAYFVQHFEHFHVQIGSFLWLDLEGWYTIDHHQSLVLETSIMSLMSKLLIDDNRKNENE